MERSANDKDSTENAGVKYEDSGLEDISDEEEEDDDDDDEDDDDWVSGDDEDVGKEGDEDDTGGDDDDESEEEDDEEEAFLEVSDSGGEETERCPICLDRFRDQDVGTPESCDHTFCLECIQEWSKNVNTCPADRQVFHLILCKHSPDDIIYKKIPVEDRNVHAEDEEDEPVYCEVCHESDREDRLLLCDGCDNGYHLECLTPPLLEVPVDEWFCPRCARREVPDPDYVEEPVGRHRRIARTLVSERVRSAIEELRVERARVAQRLLESDEVMETDDKAEASKESSSGVSTATTSSLTTRPAKKTPVKRKTPRKYKKRRTKKKTVKKKTSKKRRGRKGKKKTGKKRKKGKVKKLARTARPMPVTTPKARIADALGLSKPPAGRTIPMQKVKQEKSLDMKRGDIGADSLSIFGSRDELIHFEDEQTVEAVTSCSGSNNIASRKYSRLALSSYKPIGRVPVLPAVREKKPIEIKTKAVADSGSTIDLLGDIMKGQDRLNMSSRDLTIERDGSLTAKSTPRYGSKSSEISPPTSLFKSSFKAVDKKLEKSGSVKELATVGDSKAESNELSELDEEEYDPAHPTDDIELDADSAQNVDVYDPAYPTDDLSSDGEMLDNDLYSGENRKREINEHSKSDLKTENRKEMTGIIPLDHRSSKIEFSIKSNLIVDKTKNKTPDKEVSKVQIKSEKTEASKVVEIDKFKDVPKIDVEINKIDKTSATASKESDVLSNVKTSPVNSSKSNPLNTPKPAEQKAADKTASADKTNSFKKSPSVKITETSRKSASSIKPFEISRKTLFEKKRLYGGEIDFSEDVDFSEGAFPETFEINVKKIEEVFKGTLKKPDTKPVEAELKQTDTITPVVNENKIDENKKKFEAEKRTESDKSDGPGNKVESFAKTKTDNDTADKEQLFKKKENIKIESSDQSSDVHESSKEKLSRSDENIKQKPVMKKSDNEDKSKTKLSKDSKDKIKITVETARRSSKEDESAGLTKLSVSDRFKKLKEGRRSSEVGYLEEEDPIHEMRKLDKELELEFGKSAFTKKKEKDKEGKKTKRKIYLDDLEKENLKLRKEPKESREKRKISEDDREEGEVDDDMRIKEKKRKDKKRRKSEKDAHYHDEFLEPGDSDIDRRIVIQVSQNNDDRTVWEEAERQRKKRDREDRKKEKTKDGDREQRREKRYKRGRSRSMSYERRHKSRSRERRRSKSWSRDRNRSRDRDMSRDRDKSKERDRSRDITRRKRRERSHSRSRERSCERSKKKKKQNRSKDRESRREWSPSKSKERDWSRERDLSVERSQRNNRDRSRDRRRSREVSEEKVDVFGRSRSPYTRKELLKDKKNVTPRKKPKKEKIFFDPDEVIILDSPPHPKDSKYDEISSESDKGSPGRKIFNPEKVNSTSKTDNKSKQSIEKELIKDDEPKERIEAITCIEPIIDRSKRTTPPPFEETDDKDDEDDDEPEETEQFQYTDREEFIGQNKSRQMRQNLITIGINENDFNQVTASSTTVPTPPPLPEPLNTPTPPLPPTAGEFAQFPPPPPGPPPQGPLSGTVILQERPLHIPAQVGTQGQGILGEHPILIQGPPPSVESGPPGLIQQGPNISVPVNINVLPPGFHRGLPPTITPQRQVLVSPLRPSTPRLQRLSAPGGVGVGWQVNSPEIIKGQFPPRIPSPQGLPGHPVINGPFEGLPAPPSEALPPHSLPPSHISFPPPSIAPGDPTSHVLTINRDTPPLNVVQIHVDVNEAPRHLRQPGPEPQLLHLGPDPRGPPPRLPIPLLPPSSEPPPMSVMVSMPLKSSDLMTMPPSLSIPETFSSAGVTPNSVSAILGLARIGTGSLQMATSTAGDRTGISNISTTERAISELEKISELLSTQAHLMTVSKEKMNDSVTLKTKVDDVFKVPFAPAGKSHCKNGIDATEVVDMEIGSPINEEGNIELPVSPQFDNLIDNPEDLLEEDFNKKMLKLLEKDKPPPVEEEKQVIKSKTVKDVKNQEVKKDSPQKLKEEKQKRSSKENKHGHHHHRSRKHRSKPEAEKDLAEKALKDAHLDLDAQDVPSSAVDMTNKEKYLKKLHLQERVVEEVKMAIKPFYSSKKVTKDQYKEILRKAVPKICHSKSGNINPLKIKSLVEAYVEKYTKHSNHSHMRDKKEENSPTFDKVLDPSKGKTSR